MTRGRSQDGARGLSGARRRGGGGLRPGEAAAWRRLRCAVDVIFSSLFEFGVGAGTGPGARLAWTGGEGAGGLCAASCMRSRRVEAGCPGRGRKGGPAVDGGVDGRRGLVLAAHGRVGELIIQLILDADTTGPAQRDPPCPDGGTREGAGQRGPRHEGATQTVVPMARGQKAKTRRDSGHGTAGAAARARRCTIQPVGAGHASQTGNHGRPPSLVRPSLVRSAWFPPSFPHSPSIAPRPVTSRPTSRITTFPQTSFAERLPWPITLATPRCLRQEGGPGGPPSPRRAAPQPIGPRAPPSLPARTARSSTNASSGAPPRPRGGRGCTARAALHERHFHVHVGPDQGRQGGRDEAREDRGGGRRVSWPMGQFRASLCVAALSKCLRARFPWPPVHAHLYTHSTPRLRTNGPDRFNVLPLASAEPSLLPPSIIEPWNQGGGKKNTKNQNQAKKKTEKKQTWQLSAFMLVAGYTS